MDCKIKNGRSTGFSLIETIIGMVVVGIMVVALYGALSSGFRTEQLNREDLRATQILVEKMDQLRVVAWDDWGDTNKVPRTFEATLNPEETAALRTRVITTPSGFTNIVVTPAPNRSAYKSIVFSGTITVAAAPNDTTYNADMKQVTVGLNWKSSSGMDRSRSFTTFVARYGMQNYKY